MICNRICNHDFQSWARVVFRVTAFQKRGVRWSSYQPCWFNIFFLSSEYWRGVSCASLQHWSSSIQRSAVMISRAGHASFSASPCFRKGLSGGVVISRAGSISPSSHLNTEQGSAVLGMQHWRSPMQRWREKSTLLCSALLVSDIVFHSYLSIVLQDEGHAHCTTNNECTGMRRFIF